MTESSGKGKVRFQIQALRATSHEEVIKLVDSQVIKPPIPGINILGPPCFGWIMPIAVRATSGHSVNLRVELKPELIMRKLTLKTAWTLKGAYHVTSPSHLMSILKHGIVPGGEKQRRLMTEKLIEDDVPIFTRNFKNKIWWFWPLCFQTVSCQIHLCL